MYNATKHEQIITQGHHITPEQIIAKRAAIFQNIIFNVLMGECPKCGDRFEFTPGHCPSKSISKKKPHSLPEIETKLNEWITLNKNDIIILLDKQNKMNVKLNKMSWRDYDPDTESEDRDIRFNISKYTKEICTYIPILGLIDNWDYTTNSYNHITHILELLCFTS